MAKGILKDRLLSGEVVHGLLSPNIEPDLVETFGRLGFDLYILDTEHGTAGPIEATAVVRACEGAGLAPLVRPRGLDAKLILQFLDAGMTGVMLPGVRSADDVRRLARLDLRQDERLAVRARDPVLLLLGPEKEAVRAHRRDAAEADRRIFHRLDEAPHVVGAPDAGQHDARHSRVEKLQDQLRVEAARPHEWSETRPFAGAHDGRGFDWARRAVLRVEDVEVESEAPEGLDEIRLDVRRQEAVHDLTREEPVFENAFCHVPSLGRDAPKRAVEVVRRGRALSRALREARHEDARQEIGQVRSEQRDVLRLEGHVAAHDLARIAPSDGARPREQLIEDDADRVDVAPRIELAADRLFGAHVV